MLVLKPLLGSRITVIRVYKTEVNQNKLLDQFQRSERTTQQCLLSVKEGNLQSVARARCYHRLRVEVHGHHRVSIANRENEALMVFISIAV